MDGHSLLQRSFALLPWIALWVGVFSVVVTFLVFGAFVMTNLLRSKAAPDHGGGAHEHPVH